MHNSSLVAILFLMFLVLSACERATEDEKRMLNLLNRKYADKYSFAYEPYCYVRVKTLQGSPDYNLISNEYRAYLAQVMGKEKTGYRYFNLYDGKGSFLYQMHIGTDGTLTTGSTEHF